MHRFCEDVFDRNTIERAADAISLFSNVLDSIISSLISFLVIVGESTVGVGTCATVDGSKSGDESVSLCVVNHSSV